MFGTPSLRLWRGRFIITFCLILLSGWLVPTAFAQTSQTSTITGTVHNGTTNAPAPEGTQVTLHAYDSSYTATDTITTALDANGRFQFTLTDKPNDWVYMVSTHYHDLSFSSTIASLTDEQPLDLSLTVYDTSSDPTNIVLDQLSITLATYGQAVQVNELYSFANVGTAVYLGSSEAAGVQISLPRAAQTPGFEQGMGPNSGFFPIDEVVAQDGQWLVGAPLRPGPNSLTLRISYNLPISELDLTRPLPYQTDNVLVAVPDELTFATNGWQQQATQSAGERGALQRFSQQDLASGSSLALAFSQTAPALDTSTSLTSSTTSDWILSLAILLLVATIAFRLLRLGQRSTAVPQLAVATGHAPPTLSPGGPDKAERWQLLFALADLDNAYKNGQLSEADYQSQRRAIKARLRNIWEVV